MKRVLPWLFVVACGPSLYVAPKDDGSTDTDAASTDLTDVGASDETDPAADGSDAPDPDPVDPDPDPVDPDPDPVDPDPDPVDPDPIVPDPVDTGANFVDDDGDGVHDPVDNCEGQNNPRQTDLDGDLIGDVCDDDRDGDRLDDVVDPEPDDPFWPGFVSHETIYPHTSSALFAFDVVRLTLRRVGAFTFDRNAGEVTDLAIDENGIMYVITWTDLFLCRPADATCRWQGALSGDDNNGLTFVPPGVIGAAGALAGMGDQSWYHVEDNGNRWNAVALGQFDGLGTTSSGDAFSIQGVGTYATVNYGGITDYDELVEIDPANGAILSRVVAFDRRGGHSSLWGLAGWTDGFIYAFDSSGDILQIDTIANDYNVLDQTVNPWWGAGVRSVVTP